MANQRKTSVVLLPALAVPLPPPPLKFLTPTHLTLTPRSFVKLKLSTSQKSSESRHFLTTNCDCEMSEELTFFEVYGVSSVDEFSEAIGSWVTELLTVMIPLPVKLFFWFWAWKLIITYFYHRWFFVRDRGNLKALRAEVRTLRKAHSDINTPDNFAAAARLRRRLTKAESQLNIAIAAEKHSARASMTAYALRVIAEVAVTILTSWYLGGTAILWTGLTGLPEWIQGILAAPSSPVGSIGLWTWSFVCAVVTGSCFFDAHPVGKPHKDIDVVHPSWRQ